MLPQQAITYGSAACVHPSAASSVSVGRNSTVRYMASPVEIQQHQAQFPTISSHSSCYSSAVSPAVAAATAADANWLSQQLCDMQRLRQSMIDGMCRTQQPSTFLPPPPPPLLLQVKPATSVDEMTSKAPNDCENRNMNAASSVTALYNISPPRAGEQPLHSHANARRQGLPNSRRDSHHPGQYRRHTSPYMSSEEESFSTVSVSSHTDDEKEAGRVSRHLKQYQSKITDDEKTGLIAYYAANNETDEKTTGQATTTPAVVHPAPADIEAMYTNFLTVSRKLSSLIADYYATSNVGGQQSLQVTQRNDPQQSLSAEAPSHPQHEHQHRPSKRPSLILPSPLRRSLESRRNDPQSQPLPQIPPPVPPHRQPQSQVDVALKVKQQQHQHQQQQEQLPENAKEVQRTSRKGDRKKHLRHQHQQKQKPQDLRPRDDRAAAAGKASGIGHRIRASLGRLSPRLRSRPPPLPPPPQAFSNSQTLRTPTPTQQLQPSQLPRMNMPQAAAAATQPPDDSIFGSNNETTAAAIVSLDTRIRLVPDGPPGQSLDPCLQKLQRLRSTVLGLVQRSVDPVLQSLHEIQGHQRGDETEGGSQREAAASTANMNEVLVSLQDVMSLMELLSRSVMLVSMHNLDPNSLKLVYLSSSYIRSLKRLSKTLANSGPGSTEPGSDPTQDEGLKM